LIEDRNDGYYEMAMDVQKVKYEQNSNGDLSFVNFSFTETCRNKKGESV
jgi:hypothetical protein